jgi:hypothetical protein
MENVVPGRRENNSEIPSYVQKAPAIANANQQRLQQQKANLLEQQKAAIETGPTVAAEGSKGNFMDRLSNVVKPKQRDDIDYGHISEMMRAEPGQKKPEAVDPKARQAERPAVQTQAQRRRPQDEDEFDSYEEEPAPKEERKVPPPAPPAQVRVNAPEVFKKEHIKEVKVDLDHAPPPQPQYAAMNDETSRMTERIPNSLSGMTMEDIKQFVMRLPIMI